MTKSNKKIHVYINELPILNNGIFVYDGYYRIYICESEKDVYEAMDLGYRVFNIDYLEDIYRTSCPILRSISNWTLEKQYATTFQDAKISVVYE